MKEIRITRNPDGHYTVNVGRKTFCWCKQHAASMLRDMPEPLARDEETRKAARELGLMS